MRTRFLLLAASIAVAAVCGVALAAADTFPETIGLPDGFRPEGIAIGPRATFYVGSIGTGAVYRGSLRTGAGAELVPGDGGRSAIGVDLDQRGRLFVAGGATGQAYVYDAKTGTEIATYALTVPPTFVNDVIVTSTGAYFTDSTNPFLYRIPIGRNGELGAAEAIPLGGDIVYGPGNNANGIEATPNGKTLVIVQSNTGQLFAVSPESGNTDEIDLGGESVPNGDGILLDGRTLYVVQNRLNQVAVIDLASSLATGTVVTRFTDDDLDVPSTIDELGHRLYAVNARFTTPPTPTTKYSVTQLQKP